MRSKITFKADWDHDPEKKSGIYVREIFCGEAEDIPVPLYMGILKAMLQVENLLNGEDQLTEPRVLHSNLPITSPGESLEEMGALREDVIEDTIKKGIGEPVKKKRLIKTGTPPPPDLPSPPTPKTVVTNDNKHKRYTVEEKTEIAMMYASGISLQAIAEKFNRSTASIQKLISNMGVHRGDDLLVPEQGDTTDSKSDRPTNESKGSVLQKPWYLQSQKPNNREKAKQE